MGMEVCARTGSRGRSGRSRRLPKEGIEDKTLHFTLDFEIGMLMEETWKPHCFLAESKEFFKI